MLSSGSDGLPCRESCLRAVNLEDDEDEVTQGSCSNTSVTVELPDGVSKQHAKTRLAAHRHLVEDEFWHAE